jgi:hypothetical protein
LFQDGKERESCDDHINRSQVDHDPRRRKQILLGLLLILSGILVCAWSGQRLLNTDGSVRTCSRWPSWGGLIISFCLLVMGHGLCFIGKAWP